MKKFLILIIAVISVLNVRAEVHGKPKKPKLPVGMYVQFNTNKGEIICWLEYKKAPMTVANFVGLAEGKLKVDSVEITKPYYDGLVFHRVIQDFMIQGGDPTGTGSGSPGYKFFDETNKELTHSGAGVLSMANSDPRTKEPWSNTGMTNGSQFFITHKETSWLDGKHTVFGHVVSGQDVVNSIAQGDTMITVKILRVGKEAKKWNAMKEFEKVYRPLKNKQDEETAYFNKIASMSNEEYSEYMYQEIKKDYPNAVKSESGLVYLIEEEGTDPKASSGNQLSVHYRGTFRKDGTQFDASYDRGQPMEFVFMQQRMIPGFEEGLAMLGKGGKAKLFIPYYAAYGAAGRPGAIPPYSDLIFEIEIVDLKMPVPHDHDHDHDGHDHQH